MSRTNPAKKKRRAAKNIILIYGEGMSEEMFLKHLRGLYAKNSGIAVTIRKGNGGSAENIVKNAARYLGDFDKRVVVLDDDKSQAEMEKADQEAMERNVVLIKNAPCIESTLLSILNNGQSFEDQKSGWCKKEFESKHIPKKKRKDKIEYEKLFSKTLLDKCRKKIPSLEEIIALMEGSV